MDKEKVLLPHRNNRGEIATSTQSSLQVQRASVARMTPTVNSSDFVILSFFFFFFFFFFLVFSQKLRGRVTRNIEKKHMALEEGAKPYRGRRGVKCGAAEKMRGPAAPRLI